MVVNGCTTWEWRLNEDRCLLRALLGILGFMFAPLSSCCLPITLCTLYPFVGGLELSAPSHSRRSSVSAFLFLGANVAISRPAANEDV